MISSPAADSALNGSSQLFEWRALADASRYRLWMGNSPNGDDHGKYASTGTSTTATGLPTDGSSVYATIKWYDGSWHTEASVSFKAATSSAVITSPTADSILDGSSQNFEWRTFADASTYRLWLGSTAGGSNYGRLASTDISTTATALPTEGSTVYATLKWYDGSWHTEASMSFTAATNSAAITSPTAGSNLSSSQLFEWRVLAGASTYRLWLGSTPGGSDYGRNPSTDTSTKVTALPTDGSTVYATLKWYDGNWHTEVSVSFTAAIVSSAIH